MNRMRFCFLLAVNYCFVTPVCAQSADTQSLCGPRCVKQVLEHYGRDADLFELIVEMHGGIVGQPSNVEDIEAALQKRGIYSKAIRTGFLTLPKWPHPAILHYRRGHFAVLGETKLGYAQIRDGAAMKPTWTWIPSLMFHQSGIVVLTSDARIERDIPVVRWPRFGAALICIGIGGIGLFLRRTLLSRAVSQFSRSRGVGYEKGLHST